jgi:hypothetical protein
MGDETMKIKSLLKDIFWKGKCEIGCMWLALITGIIIGFLMHI